MAELESILPPEFIIDMEVAILLARKALDLRPDQYSAANLLLNNALYKAYAAGVASHHTDHGRSTITRYCNGLKRANKVR